MRAIFIFLLIANAVFFGYHYLSDKAGDAQSLSEKKGSGVTNASELQLLVERGGEDGAAKKILAEKKVIAETGKPSGSDFCTMIGPYSQLLQAEYALEHLVSLGVGAHITPIEIKEGELYWVYLLPEMSEKEALRRLYELQSKGIESHVITKGELANGISFGRFADYAQAEARLSELKNLGYGVDIKMLPKVIHETWLVVEPGFDEKVDEAVWVNLLSKEESLEKRQNFCLGVDSL